MAGELIRRIQAMARAEINNQAVLVCEVYWRPGTRTWDINARGTDEDGEPDSWGGTQDVPEGELAEGLGLARDIMTGG